MFGGMARWDGLDLFGPNFASVAYRRKGEIHVKIEPSALRKPTNPALQRISRWPIIRSFFLWGRVFAQVFGSVWSLLFFAGMLGVLWLFVRLMQLGSGVGTLGGAFAFFAEFPILPILLIISEAWFIFGKTRPSIAVGNFLQRYFTTTEPRRSQLEVAVESLNRLLQAEEEREDGMAPVRVPARY